VLRLFKSKPPLDEDQRDWADRSFKRLGTLLGAGHLLDAAVILPTLDCFPDVYDQSEEALRQMVDRVATAMHVDPSQIDVQLFESAHDLSSTLVPFFSGKGPAAPAGLYFHTPDERQSIAVNASELKDPMALVAVIAHEIGHVILLRPGSVAGDEPDMEPLNDLLTIFLGFGIFTANAAFNFSQYTTNQSQGWSTKRLGYLSEPMLGYGLARYAYERREEKPDWAGFVNSNIKPYMKRSLAWLSQTEAPRLLS
jgi:hypothetical protein